MLDPLAQRRVVFHHLGVVRNQPLQMHQRARVARRKLDRVQVRNRCLGEPPLSSERKAEVLACVVASGIDRDGGVAERLGLGGTFEVLGRTP